VGAEDEVASGGVSAGTPPSDVNTSGGVEQRITRTKTSSVPASILIVNASFDCAIGPTDDLVTEAAINTSVTNSAVNAEGRMVRTRAQFDVQKCEVSLINQLARSVLPIVPLNA
jgi:hypothetical protein